nr:carbohydrate binding domain-containing protein [Cohnella sp. REN36]
MGRDIEITFADREDWRSKVTAVAIDGNALNRDQYGLTAGRLLLRADCFAAPGSHVVTVSAAGYADASALQTILSGDGNLVVNGDFASGASRWLTWSGEGGAAELSVASGVGTVAVAAKGGPTWANQLYQEDIPMSAGKTYELRFDAASTATRPITVEFTNTSAGALSFVLTPETTTFAKTFTVATDAPLKLNFLLGNVVFGDAVTPDGAHAISLSHISVKEVEAPTPTGHELLNGSFDSGTDHWSLFKKAGESDATMDAADGVLHVRWTNYDGYEYWATQVYQEDLALTASKTYVLSLRVRSSIDKDLLVSIENGANSGIQYLPVQPVHLTGGGDFRTVTFELTPGAQSVSNAKLVFQMGGNHAGSHTIDLDDIVLTEKP